MAEQNTSIKTILDKISRHPMLQQIPFETLIDYSVDFMRLVGVPNMFAEKVALIQIKDYRALLPVDFYQINQIRSKENNQFVYRYSNDSFHMSSSNTLSSDYTYKIQGNYIYTNNESGVIEVSYQAFALDNEGYPLIPDNSSFSRALVAFIKKQEFTTLFEMGKIQSGILAHIEQEYAFAVADCASEFNRLTVDKAESFFNSWGNLMPNRRAHLTGFATEGGI